MRRALIFRRHALSRISREIRLFQSLSSDSKRAMHGPPLFFALTANDRAFPLVLCLSKKATDGTGCGRCARSSSGLG